MILDVDGTITSPILEGLIRKFDKFDKGLACKNIFIDTLAVQVTGDSLMMYQLQTDGLDPQKRENYWMKTLKTMTSYGLNIEDSVYSYP